MSPVRHSQLISIDAARGLAGSRQLPDEYDKFGDGVRVGLDVARESNNHLRRRVLRFDSMMCVAAPTSPRHCEIAEAHTLPAKENVVNEVELGDNDLELASQLSIIGNK